MAKPRGAVPRGTRRLPEKYRGVIGFLRYCVDLVFAFVNWWAMQRRWLKPLWRKIYGFGFKRHA